MKIIELAEKRKNALNVSIHPDARSGRDRSALQEMIDSLAESLHVYVKNERSVLGGGNVIDLSNGVSIGLYPDGVNVSSSHFMNAPFHVERPVTYFWTDPSGIRYAHGSNNIDIKAAAKEYQPMNTLNNSLQCVLGTMSGMRLDPRCSARLDSKSGKESGFRYRCVLRADPSEGMTIQDASAHLFALEQSMGWALKTFADREKIYHRRLMLDKLESTVVFEEVED